MKISISTPDGEFLAHYSNRGLAQLDFPIDGCQSIVQEIGRDPLPPELERWHAATVAALKEALAGKPPRALPPLDLSGGTEFQQKVWNALRRIASGKTRSYAEMAGEIGKPAANRAVGGACGANPIPVLIPCHRVLAANRRLGGFSGGLDWKRKLLAREGIRVEA